MSFNTPQFADGQIRRYVHQPLTVEHHGINMTIKSNGQVFLSKVIGPAKDDPKVMEVDEIQIPASLIFKAASLLRATRTVKYLSLAEAAAMGPADDSEG